MKFGIIKERKNPPDRRVVFSPEELKESKLKGMTVLKIRSNKIERKKKLNFSKIFISNLLVTFVP